MLHMGFTRVIGCNNYCVNCFLMTRCDECYTNKDVKRVGFISHWPEFLCLLCLTKKRKEKFDADR